MPIYSILHRWTRCTIAVIEAPTYSRALEWATRRGMSLIDADLEGLMLNRSFLAHADLRGARVIGTDLSGTYLRKADLRGADLRRSQLVQAFLREIDLRQTDLREAELTRADLRGARIVGADLRGTIITGARLAGAICDWRWSVIPAELLRQYSGSLGEESRLVIDLAFFEDRRAWGWLKLLSGYGNRANWALAVLAKSVRDGDNAPQLLRCLAADSSRSIAVDAGSTAYVSNSVQPERDRYGGEDQTTPRQSDITSEPRMLWTSRRTSVLGTSQAFRHS